MSGGLHVRFQMDDNEICELLKIYNENSKACLRYIFSFGMIQKTLHLWIFFWIIHKSVLWNDSQDFQSIKEIWSYELLPFNIILENINKNSIYLSNIPLA